MAIYSLRVTPISRGAGRSAVAAAAYRTRDKIHNEYDGKTYDYRRKSAVQAAAYRSGENDFRHRKDVVYNEIMLPKHAPKEFQDGTILWNSAEKSEKNSNARTAREVLVALPIELPTEKNIEALRDFIQKNFVDEGMCAGYSIHSGHIHDREDEKYPLEGLTIRKENPHAHIQLTVRPLNEDGTWGNKARKEYILDKNGERIRLKSGKGWRSNNIPLTDWDKPETLMKWRESWAATINKKFEELGIDERIDHRTLKAQGIDREPTKHIGVVAWNLAKKGIETERLKEHREIVARNKEREHQAKVRFYGVESEFTGEEYSKILLDNEIEHIGKFSRQQLQQNRRIDGTIKWYKTNAQEIEREIADLLLEKQKTGIFDFKRRKSIKTQVEKLNENKARFETAFFKKYNVELKNADILRTEQEELQVSKNYLEARKIKGALGKLKFEYIQNQSLQGEKRTEFLQKQEDEIAKIELKINDLQSKQTNVSSKKGLALEWETLQREKLTQKLIDEVVADIGKIKYSSAIQRNQAQEKAIPIPDPPVPESQSKPTQRTADLEKQQETQRNQPTTAERERQREQEISKRRELRNYQRKYYSNEKDHDYERSR